jgi:hypothetical protein
MVSLEMPMVKSDVIRCAPHRVSSAALDAVIEPVCWAGVCDKQTGRVVNVNPDA